MNEQIAPPEMYFHLDCVSGDRIDGWAFGRHHPEIIVEAWSDGGCVGRSVPSIKRPDVLAGYPDVTHSQSSGFSISLSQVKTGRRRIDLVARTPASSDALPLQSVDVYVIDEETWRKSAEVALDGRHRLPMPADVCAAMAVLFADEPIDLTTDVGQNAFVDRLLFLTVERRAWASPNLIRHIRFLRATWAHAQFVDAYFPQVNRDRSPDAKDRSCRASSSQEIMSIIHHLYVLKSAGLTGAFAEFGCFKGFSSAKLSYACGLLGIPMLIFDSFEGLPPTESTYYQAGDFAGGLEEVRSNILKFGAIYSVTFQKGFFAESLRRVSIPPLMLMWMDVDLLSSAEDVMTVADRLDPRGAVFSHECLESQFNASGIEPGPENDGNVVPPIVNHLAARGKPAGRFLCGFTGAFWRSETGVPVMSNAALTRLVTNI